MGVKFIKDETLSGIAAAIREKTGGTEAVATNAMAAAIASIAVGGGDSGGGLINGFKFDCGTFDFAADQSANHTQEHKNVGSPVAIFVYIDNAPVLAEDGSQLRYRLGGYWMNTNCAEIGRSGAVLAVNGGTAVATGGNAARNRIDIKSSTSFSVNCDGTYPLRGGLTYHWLIIGGG